MPIRLLAAAALFAFAASAQDPKAVLDAAAKNLGAPGLRSIQYSGTGASFQLGQNVSPSVPWPRFTVKSYTRAVNYETVASREEMVRVRDGQPPAPEQRVNQLVSGQHAWNVAGNNPAPAQAALAERLSQIWLTPHGFLKAAAAANAAVKSQTIAGKKVNAVSFLGHGKFKVSGILNDQGLVEKTETWLDNPVLGDMRVETTYSDYKDFGGVKFPTRIVQKQGGHPTLDLTVADVRPNAAVQIDVPEAVRAAAAPAPARVEAQKVADGVWYLTGGSHHSVAVEFKDHVVVIEGPLNEERSQAVIAEVKKTVPGKPLKYLVNTHHHFDHSGGIRTYAAEGATIVTHQINRSYYETSFRAPRTLNPDRLAKEKRKTAFLTVADRRVLTDGSRTLELHLIKGNAHNDGILMAYLPKEKLLVEADVFTPTAPGAPPSPPNPFSVNLYENVQRLKLDVGQILALHGRAVPLSDLEKAIGKSR